MRNVTRQESQVIVGYLAGLLIAKDKRSKQLSYRLKEAIFIAVFYLFAEWCLVGSIISGNSTQIAPYVAGFFAALICDQTLDILTIIKNVKKIKKEKAH